METQKIVNLLNNSGNEYSRFATKKWNIIDSESNGNYSHKNPIKFLTISIESSLCDYSDTYILVTGNINVAGGNNNTKVVFKNYSPFRKCRIEINETFINDAEHINIAIPIYNLIGYSNNYSDTSGSLWQFKRDEIEGNVDLTVDANHIPNNSSSFKYKSSFITNRNGVKIAVPLKYLSNFWRSLEMPLINCRVELSLTWNENCILTSLAGNSTFTITDAKLYIPVVTLSIEDNAKLTKLLSDGFKRSVYWNKYKLIPNKIYNANDYIRELLDASYQGVKRLFVLAYDNTGDNPVTADSHRRYFLPRIKIENYNIKIDGKSFYDQPINDWIKQYDEVRKVSTGQGDDYTTGCLLDFSYFEKNYRLIAADLSEQKVLDADPTVIQQIIFTDKASGNIAIYYILEQSKETILNFSKETTNVL